jgi:hypothetical protein
MAFSFKELFKKEDHEILQDVRKLSFHPVEKDQIQDSKDAIKGRVENTSPFELVEESSQAINKKVTESNTNFCSENSFPNQDKKDNEAGLNFLDEPSTDPPFSWSHDPINKENTDGGDPFLHQSIGKCEDQETQNIPGTNDSSDFFLSESEIDKNFSFIKEESLEQLRGNEFWPLGKAESSKLKKTALRSLEDLSPTSRNVEEKLIMPFILDDGEINYEYILKQIEAMPGIKKCALISESEESFILSQLPCSSEYFNKVLVAELRSFCSKFELMNENPLTISYKQERVSCFNDNSLFISVLHGPDELGSDVERKIIDLLSQISKTAEVYQ